MIAAQIPALRTGASGQTNDAEALGELRRDATGRQEAILQAGQADLIAIGRQALFDPNWALHAELALGVENDFASWPMQSGWWLDKRQRSLTPEDAAAAVKRAAGA